MFWLLMTALAAAVTALLVMAIRCLHSRREMKASPGVFRTKMRVRAGNIPGLTNTFPRCPGYAVWVHDVLVLHCGLALARTRPIAVDRVTDFVAPAPRVKGLGADAVVLRLVDDDGARIEVAGPAHAGELMVGPFAAALLSSSAPLFNHPAQVITPPRRHPYR